MKNKTINIGTVAEVAKGLMELRDSIVFVGGSVISLHADDPSADEIRPTGDIDITVRIFQEDFEDVIYVLDNRESIVDKIIASPEAIKNFVVEELTSIWERPNRDEMLSVQLHPFILEERLPLLSQKVNKIIKI